VGKVRAETQLRHGRLCKQLEQQCASLAERKLAQVTAVEIQEVEHKVGDVLGVFVRQCKLELAKVGTSASQQSFSPT
jgi:hypothetical protein